MLAFLYTYMHDICVCLCVCVCVYVEIYNVNRFLCLFFHNCVIGRDEMEWCFEGKMVLDLGWDEGRVPGEVAFER